MMEEKKRRGLIIAGSVIACVCLFVLGIWLISWSTKQSTRPKPEPAQVQIQAEKPAVKKVAKVAKKPAAKPKPAAIPTAPTPAPAPAPVPVPTPAVINVYCNCTPQVQASTPAPTPPVSLPPKIPPQPPQAQATGWWIVITDQTQSYTDSWGLRWVIDTNGDFYCPWVENPTGWVDGHLMWMFHPDYPKKGWYTKLAPGCYR